MHKCRQSFLVIPFLVLFSAAPLSAQCTVSDVKGDYATQPKGFLTSGPFAGPFAATGVIHFFGDGSFAGTASSSFNGHVIFPFNARGLYTVTEDCIVTTQEFLTRIRFQGFLSATKNEVVMIQPDEETITLNDVAKIQTPESGCTQSHLNGKWNLLGDGDNIITANRHAEHTGLSFDGKGAFTGGLISSEGGDIRRTTVSGAYTMNSDCTFRAKLTGGDGRETWLFGVLFGPLDQMYYIHADDGIVIRGGGRVGAF